MAVTFLTQCWFWTQPPWSGARWGPLWCPGPGTGLVRSPTGRYKNIVTDSVSASQEHNHYVHYVVSILW